MNFNYIKDLEYAKSILEITDKELCGLLGVSRMTFYRWLNKSIVPSKDNLEKIYTVLYDKNIKINLLKEEIYKAKNVRDVKILYHGAKGELLGDITIEKSEQKKDFGKGFYLGESLLQSASFVSNYPHSSVYVVRCDVADLRIKEFDVSSDWMILISFFRGKIDEYKNSPYLTKLLSEISNIDLVIAPIADNTMYEILDDFANGEITDLQCLHALSANWLGKQYVFLNDAAINKSITLIDRLYICEKEKKDYVTKREENSKIGRDKVKLAKRAFAGKGKYIEELLK